MFNINRGRLFRGIYWSLFLLYSSHSLAVDISNPLNLLFVADRKENLIDVIDVANRDVVYQINTSYQVDSLFVSAYAPFLFFTNIDKKLLIVYDLKLKQVIREIALPIIPRHLVPDVNGERIAITDSIDGGLFILSTYDQKIVHVNKKFPSTGAVLFDPTGFGLYYSNNTTASIGLMNLETYEFDEISLIENAVANFSAPSRSLDGRYIYVSDHVSQKIYSLNAFSGVIIKTFDVGLLPARPYTTPEGVFLYMMDADSGRFISVSQSQFATHHDIKIGEGIDMVAVGRFERLNLLLSSKSRRYYIYDNLRKSVIDSGELSGLPLATQGSVDGRSVFVIFKDEPQVALVDLEDQQVSYISATNNGSRAYALGASNNVCH